MIINIDKDDTKYAIDEGRKEAAHRETVRSSFYAPQELSKRDKVLILFSLGYARLAGWYQTWTEVRAMIWTRLGLH